MKRMLRLCVLIGLVFVCVSMGVPLTAVAEDQCDFTAQCRDKYGNKATDCKKNLSDQIVCMCGSQPCSVAQNSNGGGNGPVVAAVPGKVEAEDYTDAFDQSSGNAGGAFRNDDVDIQETSDAGGGYNVGWMEANEWLEYSIDIAESGRYVADIRVASAPGGGEFTLEINNGGSSETIDVKATGGWQNWSTISTDMGELSPGEATLQLEVFKGAFNVNWIELKRVDLENAPVDQCDSTAECRSEYGDKVTDCRNSSSNRSICMCGNNPCDGDGDINPDPTPNPDSNSDGSDWRAFPVPANPGLGKKWQLQPLSDNFNYEGKSGKEFTSRWKSTFINHWSGPGLTEWREDASWVSNGHLAISARRKPGTRKIYAGTISSKQTVKYPIYCEIRAKISNLVMASDFWLLSPDSTQEIDALEAYGSDRSDQQWFADRVHISHHVFIRRPFQDYQPTDIASWYYDGGTKWRNAFHRYGVYWKSPWHLEYYIDGKLVRTVSGKNIIDPRNYTGGTGLNKAMHVIINTEDQNWRSDKGITPTDAELADHSKNKMLVDWVRFYKPVSK